MATLILIAQDTRIVLARTAIEPEVRYEAYRCQRDQVPWEHAGQSWPLTRVAWDPTTQELAVWTTQDAWAWNHHQPTD